MLAHVDPDSLLISDWHQQCSCMMAEQQQLRLFHAEPVDSSTAGKALWQELEYYSPLPVFWCFLSTGRLKTFIQIYHCLVIKGILRKVAIWSKAASNSCLSKCLWYCWKGWTSQPLVYSCHEVMTCLVWPPWRSENPFYCNQLCHCWLGNAWAKLKQSSLSCKHTCAMAWVSVHQPALVSAQGLSSTNLYVVWSV